MLQFDVIRMRRAVLSVVLTLSIAMLISVSTSAIIPGPGTQVAIVPDPSSSHGGTLPMSDPAYANFTFTYLPWANVNAGNLAGYQIVVLLIDAGATNPPLTPPQAADLNSWVYNGGKLIIYDSEEPARDYSWLPYPFNTSNPGALGAQGSVTYMEDTSLGRDDDPSSVHYINTTIDYAGNNDWSDAIGDANVFTSFDSHWCGHIEIENAVPVIGWSHAYARYGQGLYIYNGFDIDPLSSSTTPDTRNVGAVAKIWLLELKQPWGTDYNLPCGRPVVEPEEVGGEILTPNISAMVVPLVAALSVFVAAAGILRSRKRR